MFWWRWLLWCLRWRYWLRWRRWLRWHWLRLRWCYLRCRWLWWWCPRRRAQAAQLRVPRRRDSVSQALKEEIEQLLRFVWRQPSTPPLENGEDLAVGGIHRYDVVIVEQLLDADLLHELLPEERTIDKSHRGLGTKWALQSLGLEVHQVEDSAWSEVRVRVTSSKYLILKAYRLCHVVAEVNKSRIRHLPPSSQPFCACQRPPLRG